jgi:hypothetical protein
MIKDRTTNLPKIIRFLLIFCRLRVEKATDGLWPWTVIYKMLLGKKYIVYMYPNPADHVNCKCALERSDHETQNPD